MVWLDGDAIMDLLGIDSFEDRESLTDGVDSNFLETVRVERLEDFARDLMLVDLRFILFQPESTKKLLHVVLVVIEQ